MIKNEDLERLNNKILNLAYSKLLNTELYSNGYNIIEELKYIDSFLFTFYVNNRNALIQNICNLMEKASIPSRHGNNEQLTFDRLIKENDNESRHLYNELKKSDDFQKK